MTYPLRALYYSIGLYLIKLSSEYIASINRNSEIHSFYGGDLKYDKENLILKPHSVFYRKHYLKPLTLPLISMLVISQLSALLSEEIFRNKYLPETLTL